MEIHSSRIVRSTGSYPAWRASLFFQGNVLCLLSVVNIARLPVYNLSVAVRQSSLPLTKNLSRWLQHRGRYRKRTDGKRSSKQFRTAGIDATSAPLPLFPRTLETIRPFMRLVERQKAAKRRRVSLSLSLFLACARGVTRKLFKVTPATCSS